jgi:isopenicillin N synthase-like dioxygenase
MSQPITIPTIDLSIATGVDLVVGLQANSCVFLTGIEHFDDLLGAMLAAGREFFDQPESSKQAVQWDGTGAWQGWQPVYSGGSGAAPMERFELALPDPDGYANSVDWANTFRQWPTEPDRMQPSWADYYRAMRELSIALVTMIAGALGLSVADLPAWTTRQHSNLCVNHYLAQSEPPPEGQERSRPHTDIGGITLLWGENTSGGLHVQRAGGEWSRVDFPEGALLLQAGDLLHLWSGGTIPANSHRVVNPPHVAGVTPQDRYSVVYFHHPDLDAWVAPALTEGSGVTARDHVLARQRSAYQL